MMVERIVLYSGAAMVAFCTLLSGQIVCDHLARLSCARAQPAAPAPARVILASAPRDKSAASILARNPFDSTWNATVVHADPRRGGDLAIRRVGPYTYRVDRRTLDRVLEEQSELMRFARVVPEHRDGHVAGIRIFGVRPGALLFALGFDNGDMLTHVDGIDITTPDRALNAYARFRSSDRIYVDIERKGVPLTLTYQIE